MRNKDDREECYALCHIFNVRFKVVTDWTEGGWTHQLFTVDHPDSCLLIRQETINGCDPATWRASIERLLSPKPGGFW